MRNDLNRLTRVDYAMAFVLAGIAVLLYNLTLTPSLSYISPDGNELATIPYVLGLAHMPGYPLYTWLGKVFTWLPFGDVAHRMNLMSAVLGAIGVAGLYLIISKLLHTRATSSVLRRAGAFLTSLIFAFSPTYWSQAVIAEVYVPNIALVAITILALLHWEQSRRDRDFALFALTFGLSLGTHISNLGFAPAFIIFILLTDASVVKRPTWWMAALVGFSLGVIQFAWLPLRANTLNDRIMLERAPVTLKGIYDYTLGAFPQFKFAFSLGELPDRVVVYLYLLSQQFGWAAILIGVIGLGSLLLRRTRHYYLLAGMYVVQVWFFIQYRAFDLDVFFLPAHFLWAIFLAFGIVEALGGLEALVDLISRKRSTHAAHRAMAAVTVALGLIPLTKNFEISDHSYDVAINDFYANVWEVLPSNSALLSQGGVFGYDAFYWQLVYDTRSDVLLPSLPTPNPSSADIQGRELYSTTSVTGQNLARGPGALPRDLISRDMWQVPVLIGVQAGAQGLGLRGRLVLYHLTDIPPNLIVDEANPSTRLDADMNGLLLVGEDVKDETIESGGRVHIILYWSIDQPGPYRIETSLGDQALETHEIGFGNLARYQAEVDPVMHQAIVEDYWVVVPSTTSIGSHVLTVGVEGVEKEIEIGILEIIDNEEAMDRWLRIAGK